MQYKITTATAMRKLGAILAEACVDGTIIYLQGELGAGKTTLVRGFLRKLGYGGRVRSPTYNLFEVYEFKNLTICHFDLYRLKNPEELIYIGIVDYFTEKNICLIEWPNHGKGFLPQADVCLNIDFIKGGRGRIAEIIANSTKGTDIVSRIEQLSCKNEF